LAIIGQRLTVPEAGWQRVDNNNENIRYIGAWAIETLAANYGGSAIYTFSSQAEVRFRFHGTKLRIIGGTYPGRTTTVEVLIDGIIRGTINENSAALTQVLVLDVAGLAQEPHEVQLKMKDNKGLLFDAIDIDSLGYILPQRPDSLGVLRTRVKDMEIGDCITCRYKAANGIPGTFYDLGEAETQAIPLAGTTTPDGMFYFIKADKGLLIADRSVQTGVSFDALNKAGYIEGMAISDVPVMTSNNAPRGVAKASSEYSSAYSAYRAFNGVEVETGWATKNGMVQWLSYSFPVPKIIRHYSIRSRSDLAGVGAPTDWILQGSNDELTWVDLDRQTGAFDVTSASLLKRFSFSNESPFTTYRLSISRANANNAPSLAEFQLMEELLSIRSLSGGICFSDEYGNPSLMQFAYSNGFYPRNNEWDTYIRRSSLDGKIYPGSEDVWHHNAQYTWTRDTPMAGVWRSKEGQAVDMNNYAYRVARGNSNGAIGANWLEGGFDASHSTGYAFRPAITYDE
jgi:hypothetical protein